MIKFIRTYLALSMVFLSTILTGIIAMPSFASVLVHLGNMGLLIVMSLTARDSRNFTATYILLFISLGLTAVMSEPTFFRIIVQAINIALLVAIVWVSGKEAELHSHIHSHP